MSKPVSERDPRLDRCGDRLRRCGSADADVRGARLLPSGHVQRPHHQSAWLRCLPGLRVGLRFHERPDSAGSGWSGDFRHRIASATPGRRNGGRADRLRDRAADVQKHKPVPLLGRRLHRLLLFVPGDGQSHPDRRLQPHGRARRFPDAGGQRGADAGRRAARQRAEHAFAAARAAALSGARGAARAVADHACPRACDRDRSVARHGSVGLCRDSWGDRPVHPRHVGTLGFQRLGARPLSSMAGHRPDLFQRYGIPIPL